MDTVDDLVWRHSKAEIADAVRRVARAVSEDYEGKDPLIVGILIGSFVFVADLLRELSIPAQVDFIRARSYGSGIHSAGSVQITKDIETDVSDRHVIIVEDILDTGLTMHFVRDRILAGHPASIATCALLVREGADLPHYHGFITPPGFVVGYGIDYAERYRHLPDIWAIRGTDSG